jgi:ABC-type polysaccharide/polyol phosphate export permease
MSQHHPHPINIEKERVLRSSVQESPIVGTLKDFQDGWRIRGIWLRAAYLDVRRRYVRTVIGPFWATGHIAVYIVAVGYIFSSVLATERATYIPFLATGFIPWMLIYMMLQEASSSFISASSMRQQIPVPYSMFIYSMVWRNLIVHAHNYSLYLLVSLVYGFTINWTILLLIPSYILVLCNILWIATVVATVSARYRDVQQLVAAFVQVMVFVTPIFFAPEKLSPFQRTYILWPNLLYHLVVVIRAPLLGQVPPLSSYAVLVVTAILGWAFTLWFFGKYRSRIIFWIL